MKIEHIFWLEILVIVLELITLFVLSKTLIAITKSEIFKEKLERFHQRNEKEKAKKNKSVVKGISKTTLLVIALGTSFLSSATSISIPEVDVLEALDPAKSYSEVYGLLAIIMVLLAIILYFRHLIVSFLNIDKVEEVKEVVLKETVGYKIIHALTDVVDIEDEDSVLTDHDYDGIQELDNNLPPWWKYGFYLSIFIGVIYMFNFHVIKTGDLQITEYEKNIKEKNIEVAAYLKSQALNVDENSVIILTDDQSLSQAKGLFTKYCQVCHGAQGEGKVGPNLTDDFWIYDADIKGVFSTIKYGAKRGMKSWKDELNPVQIQKLASYVLTLQGTNPANAKPPEGEFIEPDTTPHLAPEDDLIPEIIQDTLKVATN